MSYHGDIRLGDTIDFKFCTVSTSGVPTQLAGSPVISAYPGNSTTQLTAGITLSVDFDSVTGLNNVRVVASSGNGYATATNYELVITTGTVGGASVVGYVIGSFSVENRSALMPTTAYQTLDVSSGGEAGLDLTNVGILTGAYPAFGIIDSGTAQAVGANSMQLRAAAALANDSPIGSVVMLTSGTDIYATSTITDYVGSTDTATLSGWSNGATPTGTPTYIVFARAPDASLTAGLATLLKLEAAFASSGVFSAGALVNAPSDFVRSGSCTTTGTTQVFTDAATPETGSNKLKGDRIYWTGGSNAGISCRVVASAGTSITVTPAMPNAITSGDTYKLYHDAAALIADTELTDLPTNAELATALASADDAVLAAVAAVQSDTNDIQARLPPALATDGSMKSNITHVNDVEIGGSGTLLDPFGPA